MKVLLMMLSPPSAKGGMEKHFADLANGLAGAGVSVYCMSAPEHLEALDPGVNRYPVNTKGSRYSPTLISSIVKALRAQEFDLVHAQGSKSAATIQLLSPLFPKTRFIATIHNFKSRYPAANRFSRIIAVSHTLASDIGGNVTVVYNGINIERCPEAPFNFQTYDRPLWLAVGRLVHAKGFDQLIDAFQSAKGSLLIAGDGKEHEALQERIERLKLTSRVKLIGYQDDIPGLMQSVDGIVISSRREGFSYVCAEALLSGKPVVSTDVPVANELLPPQHICPTGDTAGLSSLLNTPIAELVESQAGVRDFAARELSVDSMVANTLQVYREVTRRE